MNWNEAELLLRKNIHTSLHLSPDAQFKIVKEIPPFKCKNYNSSEGFRIQVGAKNEVNIPISMLQKLYEKTILNNGIYNRTIFKENFPRELNNKPCYVHSVGKLKHYNIT
ncbi:hypothetical protein [Polaribacter atrinae]|uniref:hypothetical protein n=1 Tax=Polaribacter atrinae TaxID=1333662 RepID=UPI0030F63D08